LVLQPIAGDLPALAEEDEALSAGPGLHDVQPGVDFAPEVYFLNVPAEKDRFDRLAEPGVCLVGADALPPCWLPRLRT